jgi:hypothetical protein
MHLAEKEKKAQLLARNENVERKLLLLGHQQTDCEMREWNYYGSSPGLRDHVMPLSSNAIKGKGYRHTVSTTRSGTYSKRPLVP